MITGDLKLQRLTDYLREQCDSLREVPGVHNIVIVQKDGYPIVSSGLWLSREDVFNISSITAAIQSAIKRVHKNIKYEIIETRELNLVIFTTKDTELNLVITTNKNANLGGLFIALDKFIKNNLDVLKKIEQLSNTPLLEYDKSKKELIYRNFNVMDAQFSRIQRTNKSLIFGSSNIIIIDKELGIKINTIINTFLTSIKQKIEISIIGENGFTLFSSNNVGITFDYAFIYAMFDTATKLLYNTFEENINQITICYEQGFRLLYALDSYVLNVELHDLRTRLGLIRLLSNSLKRSILKEIQDAKMKQMKIESIEQVKISSSDILEELKI